MGNATRIWLVRHGESQAQTKESDDQVNPELTEKGRTQAMALRKPLADLHPDLILVSPLQRAVATFALSGVKAPCMRFDSRAAEGNWGIPTFYDGILPVVTPRELAEADVHDAWQTPSEIRAKDLLDDVRKGDAERVLVFGHYGIFARIFMAFCEMDTADHSLLAMMGNTAISCLEYSKDDRRRVWFWNVHPHSLAPRQEPK
ncbi:MAG: histidine phosphatase family protein [Lentisphaeria bacterium]|nr:histidine phosphatase family protein [Lentisphaeria bacterium]